MRGKSEFSSPRANTMVIEFTVPNFAMSKRCLSFSLGLTIAMFMKCMAQSSGGQPPDEAYYPLAVGNHWTYRVQYIQAPRKADSQITWTVTKVDETSKGKVLQVWPTPASPDDAAMQLLATPDGIKETTDGLVLLKFPLRPGDRWSHVSENPRTNKPSTRTYRVVSKGDSCTASGVRFADCLVIEDRDPIVNVRTITKYVRNVGPVSFQYFRGLSGKETLTSSLELIPGNQDERSDHRGCDGSQKPGGEIWGNTGTALVFLSSGREYNRGAICGLSP
jgi:hypothetical protein